MSEKLQPDGVRIRSYSPKSSELRFEIHVDNWGNFNAIVHGEKLSAETMSALEPRIDKMVRSKRNFKRMEVIEVYTEKPGSITSQVPDKYGATFRISRIPHYGGDKKVTEHTDLGGNRRYGSDEKTWRYAMNTPENLKVLEQIKLLKQQKKDIDTKIDEFRKAYTDPLSKEKFKEIQGRYPDDEF